MSIIHGTLTGYKYYNCRCDACRAVYSAYKREYRRAHSQARQHESKEIPHGTLSRYNNQRCRCIDCRAANAAYRREYDARVRERNDA